MEEKYYLVEITETAQKTVKVKASSLVEAEEKVEDAYERCEVMLYPEDCNGQDYKAREVTDEVLSLYEEVE